MRILVTGAAGFVGGLFCHAATASGLQVVGTDRRPFGKVGCEKTIVKDMVDLTTADIPLPIDAVVHFATGKGEYLVGGGGMTDADRYRRVLTETVEGTRHVCRLAESAGVRRFIHVSSMTVYPGPVPRDRHVETGVVDSRPERRGLYAHSKILAESAVRDMASTGELSMEVCILRLALVCGPGMGHAPSDARDRNRVLGSTLISTAKPLSSGIAVGIGRPTQGAPLLDVRDLIRGLLALIDLNPRPGLVRVYDVQSGAPPHKRELVLAYAASVGRRYKQWWPPRRFTIAVAWAAEWLYRLRGKREYFPYRIERAYRLNAEALPYPEFWLDIGIEPEGTLESCLEVAVMESLPNARAGQAVAI
jgi:nucleoside-diphosphate-sugar epimerase